MRHQRGIALGAALLLSGCSVPHNDVLIFGTNTKFAVDVSASAATGGVPELTVGYKRQEAVWMPLVVNAQDSAVVSQLATSLQTSFNQCMANAGADASAQEACRRGLADGLKYVGTSGGSGALDISTRSGSGTLDDRDAYSVFASFGARFGAEGGANTAEAQGGIAQFFATGVAAQRLGANARIGDALKVESTSEKTEDALRGQVEAQSAATDAEKERAEFYKDLAQERQQQLQIAGVSRRKTRRQLALEFAACALPEGADSRLEELLDAAVANETNVENFKDRLAAAAASGRESLADELELEVGDQSSFEALTGATGTVCPSQ